MMSHVLAFGAGAVLIITVEVVALLIAMHYAAKVDAQMDREKGH